MDGALGNMQLASRGTNGNTAGTVTDLPQDHPAVPVQKPSVNGGRRSGPSRGRGLSWAGRRRAAMVAATVFVVGCVLVGGAAVARKVLGSVPKVVVAVAGPASIDSQPGGVGSVGTLPQNIFSVSLDAVGVSAPITVTRVFVVPGTPVRVGSPLVALSPTPFRDNVEQLVLTLQQAESTLAADESANAPGHVAPGSYANAYLATNIPELKGQVVLDRQLLGIARGNSTSITSPVAGEVSSVDVVPGDNVGPGWLLLKIVNTSSLQVTANIELSDLPAVQVGDAATVSPSEVPGVTLYGKVVAIEPNATGGGLEGEVLVDVPNSTTGPVPLGTQVFVNISAPQRVPVAVPEVAVLNTQLNPIVLVVRHGRVYPVAVTVGASDSTWTALVSGISDGTEVAVSNTQELRAGEKVRAVPAKQG
ncbi:MAG: efflux RND transporter periplasmic adaptor subunit [Acidimicrobiales bacterium]